MPYPSKYNRFDIPEDGEEATPDGVNGPLQSIGATESWGDLIQTIVNGIEDETPMIGPVADRPAATEGLNFYYATDDQVWYYNDGGAWVADPDAGGTGAFSNLSVSDWNLVDLGNEGYDGTGSKDLSDVYATYGSNTIYILPEGTYRVSAGISDLNAFDYVGFIGRPNATLDVVDNSADQVFAFGGTNVDSKRVILKNLTIDITGTDANGFDIDRSIAYGTIQDRAIVEDIELVGSRHRYQDIDGDGVLETLGNLSTFLIKPNSPEAHVVVDGLRMPDGGTWESGAGGTSGHAVGVLSGGPDSVGTTVYKNCYVANFCNQAFYVKNAAGQWIFKGTVAENNGNANFRVGEGDTINSCASVQDNAANQAHPSGVCLSVQDARHCNVNGLEMIATDTGQDPVRISGDARSVTIQNVYLDLDSGVTCDIEGTTAGEGPLLQNWLVEDSGTPGQFAPFRINRPGTTFRNCTIYSTNRYCIKVNTGADTLTLDDCYLETGNHHLLLGEDTGVTYDRLDLRGTDFSGAGTGAGGLYLYTTDSYNRINVTDCDFNGISSPRSNINGSVSEWRTSGNRNFGPDEIGSVQGTVNATRGYAAGGVAVLEEDGNSPWNASLVTTATYTLASNYDWILVDFEEITGDATTIENGRLRVDGDTGTNYDYMTAAGNRITGASFLQFANHNPSSSTVSGRLVMNGRWSNSMAVQGPIGIGAGNNDLHSGRNIAIASPLDSLNVSYTAGNVSVSARIYGHNF